MAKSGKKRKKAEKSKTKLRQSIKLPKGLNETNASVTSKKINVLNQLRSQDFDEDRRTRKKIGVKDLMSKLKNNGIAVKLEAIDGLNELLKAYPEICQEELNDLISSVIPINNHIESKLRSAARSLINFILTQVSTNQILPLTALITAHLCCGLSHIDSDIQLDSLKLLDIIIDCSPLVIIQGHEQILPNCLDQVSLKGGKNPNSTQFQQRSVHKNVNSKVSALQWRTQVLQRVLKIVGIVQGVNETNSNSGPICGNRNYDEFNMNLVVEKTCQNVLSLQEIINGRCIDAKKETITTGIFNLNIFMTQVNDLLFQTWCEAISMDKKKQDRNMISNTVLSTLTVIVDLLLTTSQSDCLDRKLIGYIMNNFPLELLPTTSISDKHENSGKESINALNLNICLLVLRQNDEGNVNQVLDFIKGFQVNNGPEATKVSMILSLIVTNDVKQNVESLDSVIDHLITNYKNNDFVTKAMILMSTWTTENAPDQIRQCLPSVERWINGLPQLLLSSRVNLGHIEAIVALFKRKDSVLFDAFKRLDSIPNDFHVKDQFILDQVWRSLVLFPNLGIQNENLMVRMNEMAVSKNTQIFVKNMLS